MKDLFALVLIIFKMLGCLFHMRCLLFWLGLMWTLFDLFCLFKAPSTTHLVAYLFALPFFVIVVLIGFFTELRNVQAENKLRDKLRGK